MRELRERLRGTLDSTHVPDLWADAERRAPGELPPVEIPPRAAESRTFVAVVALAIFAVAAAFAWSALRPSPATDGQPGVSPSVGPSPQRVDVTVPDMIGETSTLTDGTKLLLIDFAGQSNSLHDTESASFTVPTGTRVVIGGTAETIAWGWGVGTDPYDKPVPLSEHIPIIVMGHDGDHPRLRLKAAWGDGQTAQWTLKFAVTVPSLNQLTLACPESDRVHFTGPRMVVTPGSDVFIRANLPGVTLKDAVVQVTWPQGPNSWDGTWAIYRQGALVALVKYGGLSGTACSDAGIGLPANANGLRIGPSSEWARPGTVTLWSVERDFFIVVHGSGGYYALDASGVPECPTDIREGEGWSIDEVEHTALFACADGSYWAGFDVYGQSLLGVPYRKALPALAVTPNQDGTLIVSNEPPARPLKSYWPSRH
jgi:hypothetical protein